MKFLKITLGDDKVYTFSTFSSLESRVMKKKHLEYEKLQDDINKINFEVDENGKFKKDEAEDWIPKSEISEQDKQRKNDLEDKIIEFGIDTVRKSICRKHPEFKVVEDKEKDKEIREKLEDIVDLTDIKKLIYFAFSGVYSPESDTMDFTEEIPLEENPVKQE